MERTDQSADRWRREMVVVASWLCGTLKGRCEDDEDRTLCESLLEWLAAQRAKYDTLVVGLVRCRQCSARWNVLAYESAVGGARCPSCGECDTEPFSS
jgi:hypothetical protein